MEPSLVTTPAEGANALTRRIVATAAIVLMAAGLLCVGISLIGYPTLTRVLYRASRIRPAFYAMFTLTLRCGGAVLAAAGAAAFVWLGRLSSWLALTAAACLSEAREAVAAVREFARQQSSLHRAALTLVFAGAILIRVYYLFVQPMRYDEAFTYLEYARHAVALVAGYTPNNHLLNTISVFAVTHLAGSAPASIRLPVFVAGIFVVAATWYCFGRFYGSSAGLLAAALASVNADLISFSTNARGYSFIAAMFLIQLLVAEPLARQPARRGLWAFFALLSIGEICTVPTGLYAVASSAGIYLLLAVRARHGLVPAMRPLVLALVAAGVISAFVYWPIMLGSGYDAFFSNRFVEPETVREFLARSPGSFGEIWNQWSAGWPVWFAWLVTGAAALGIIRSLVFRRAATVPVFPIAAIICIAMAIVQRVTPGTRVWLFLLPLYLGTAAVGFDLLMQRSKGAVAGLTCLILVGVGIQVWKSGAVLEYGETGANNDAINVARFLETNLKDGDLLIATLPASYPVRYYLLRAGLSESVWGSENRKIGRVLAIVDKPDPHPSRDQMNSGLFQAFAQSYVGLHRDDFEPAATIYDSNQTQVIALAKRSSGL
ncbi:MAG TPA: hypothetical protein VK789_18020 [Bryobacteraceae bacterium]|nr:hypothetical protein [Bryobacteraceae bacterium]